MSKPVTPSSFAYVHAGVRFPTFPDDRTSSVYYRTRRGYIPLVGKNRCRLRCFRLELRVGTTVHWRRDERVGRW